jgi:HK97 family phage prohead protease
MKTLDQLLKEFGARVCTLNTGAPGLRGGIHCEVRDPADGDAYEMDFIGSDNSLDRYNEVIQPSAWGDMANFKKNPVIPDCHDYSSIAKILGKAKSVAVVDGKLTNRVAFCMDNPMGSLGYKMAKAGFLKSQSVGFIPLEWTNGNDKETPDRTYTKCELLEISLVVVPANPGATIGNQIKSVLNVSERRDLADFLKQFCSEPQAPGHGGASGEGATDARLLNLARTLRGIVSGK